MMAFALVVALVAVVLTVLLRNVPEQAAASEKATTTKPSSGPLTRGEGSVEPWREKARPLPAAEVSKDATNPSRSKGEPAPGAAPASEADAMSRSEPLPQPEPQGRAEPEGQAEPEAQAEPTPGPRIPTV